MNSPGRKVAVATLIIVVALALLGWVFVIGRAPRGDAAPWAGVDETVIEKYATDAGREAREPLINTDQGDLLLFLFALAGTAGGFVAGYHWRRLISEKGQKG